MLSREVLKKQHSPKILLWRGREGKQSENFEKSDETIQEEKEEDRGTGEEVQIPSSGRLSNVNYDSDDDDDEEELTSRQKFRKRFWDFYETNEFLILVVIAICLARAYPPLGAEYLKPKITAGWIAVILIFCKFRLKRLFTLLNLCEWLT